MSGHPNPESNEAHDILAAEAFSVPGADPDLHHGPVKLPEDPSGIAEAHDILAAEEFAMPAPHHHGHGTELARRGPSSRGLVQAGAALGVALLLVRLLRRHWRS